MQLLGFNKKAVLVLLVVLTSLTLFSNFVSIIHSQSSQELLEQIKEKEKELFETQETINALESQLEQNRKDLEGASEGLPKLEAEINEIETQLQINLKKLELTEQQFELQKKQREEMISRQKNSVETLYLKWKSQNSNVNILSDDTNYLLLEGLSNKVFGVGNEELAGLNDSINDLDIELQEQNEIVAFLNSENEDLNFKKNQILEEVYYYKGVLASNTEKVAQLQDVQAQITSQINDLTVEQQQAAAREAEILKQELLKRQQQENVNIEGGFYFAGTGRDVYQGHGVGFSQFGAYGGANAGMTAEQLIKFYYTGVEISQRTGTINLYGGAQGLDVEEYLNHLGEVPDKACGNEKQVKENPDKYSLYGDSVWSCWPEETIKAQVIIARSYALHNVNLYTDARSQVYDTKYDKSWAVEETKGKVITYGGEIINAVYSSDNNQGNGTAHNDTIFQNFFGDGTPFPYLRSVNDNAFAYKTQWTNWGYKSNVYNTDSIMEMLTYIGTNPNSGYNQSVKDNVNNIISTVGQIESLSFERDPSGRIKKVFFNGVNGSSSVMGGWWFKNLWNTWTYDVGNNDYLFSQTFYIVNNE